MTTRLVLACAVLLAGGGGSGCGSSSSTPAKSREEAAPAPTDPAAAAAASAAASAAAWTPSPCVILMAGAGGVPTVAQAQGERSISGRGRFIVLDVDLATGATRPRAEIPLDEVPRYVEGAAIRGDEIVLMRSGENGGQEAARIDLATRSYEAGLLPISDEHLAKSVLASDGDAYYRSCPREHQHHLCRGKDWEARGARLELPDLEPFEAIAVSGGELYGVDGKAVRVLDLASGREARRFTLPAAGEHRRGVGIAGDELVIVSGRDTLARFDRKTGAARGTVRVALPQPGVEFRLTCDAKGSEQSGARSR